MLFCTVIRTSPGHYLLGAMIKKLQEDSVSRQLFRQFAVLSLSLVVLQDSNTCTITPASFLLLVALITVMLVCKQSSLAGGTTLFAACLFPTADWVTTRFPPWNEKWNVQWLIQSYSLSSEWNNASVWMEPYLNFHRIPFILKRIYFPARLYSYTTDWILDYLEKKQLKDGKSYDNSYGYCWLNDQICSHVIDSFELTTHWLSGRLINRISCTAVPWVLLIVP